MAYPVEVRSLFTSLSASREVSGELTLPDVELGEQVYHFEGPVAFRITLTNAGAGIVGAGAATATIRTPCARCLCDTDITVETEVESFYVLPGHGSELPEEQEYELVADDMTVDIEPSIAQSMVVDLPFAPVHAEDCKGICPVCGADRNVSDCGCQSSAAASPFDALRGLDVRENDDA